MDSQKASAAAPAKIDFDEYAAEYEDLLKSQLSFFSNRDYFSQYKVDIVRRHCPAGVGRILDFGAGVGLTLPYLAEAFPQAELFATDISEDSLARIARDQPEVSVVRDAELGAHSFDLILIFTVMHHVAPHERTALMARLEGLLNPGGKICIFEHNPFNPITQRMVSTCPFDEDAILLTMGETKRLLSGGKHLKVAGAGYTLFFPHPLRALRFLEPAMTWLPLGGQYYVIAERP